MRGLGQEVIRPDRVRRCFPKRAADSHKGTYGQVLAVCGSYGMAGAAGLAARAALRCGAGLVTMAVPQSIYPILASALLEAVFLPLPETAAGGLGREALQKLQERLPRATALLVGPGMGVNDETGELVLGLLGAATCPAVVDADGINALVPHIDRLKTVGIPLILTPHPGEMAGLMGCTVEEVQRRRVDIARQAAARTGAIVVLKGHGTVIAAPGRATLLNPTGTPGMATGGSGDVLAGMIASFLGQGMAPEDAAMCGVYLHGLCGERAAARLSQHAMLPSDMLWELAGLFLDYE